MSQEKVFYLALEYGGDPFTVQELVQLCLSKYENGLNINPNNPNMTDISRRLREESKGEENNYWIRRLDIDSKAYIYSINWSAIFRRESKWIENALDLRLLKPKTLEYFQKLPVPEPRQPLRI